MYRGREGSGSSLRRRAPTWTRTASGVGGEAPFQTRAAIWAIPTGRPAGRKRQHLQDRELSGGQAHLPRQPFTLQDAPALAVHSANRLDQSEAVQTRHRVVGDHEVGVPCREDLEALLPVGGHDRFVALRRKLGGEALCERGLVVHDEKERNGPRHEAAGPRPKGTSFPRGGGGGSAGFRRLVQTSQSTGRLCSAFAIRKT